VTGGTEKFACLRLYADEAGESHFQEVAVSLDLSDFASHKLEATASDGEVRTIGPGQPLDDTHGKGRSTRALCDVTFLVIRAPNDEG
jgi:hypothetical protein